MTNTGAPMKSTRRIAAGPERSVSGVRVSLTVKTAIAPTIDAVATELAGTARVGTVDADAHPELLQRFGVTSIPTLAFFKDGQEVDRIIGVAKRERIVARLKELAAAAA